MAAKKTRGVYFRNGTGYIGYLDQHGKLVRESTGQRSLKFAEELLAKRRTEVAEGRYFPSRQYDRVAFANLLNNWREKHGRHTRSQFEYHIPKVRERFGNRRAREIDADAVRKFLDELERAGYAASTINKYRTILCSTFNLAIRRGKYDLNPVSAVPQRKEPPGQDRFLSAQDFRKLATTILFFRRRPGGDHPQAYRPPQPGGRALRTPAAAAETAGRRADRRKTQWHSRSTWKRLVGWRGRRGSNPRPPT
jgi:integrase